MIRQLSLLPGMLALAALFTFGQLPVCAQMNGYQGGPGGANNPAGMDMLHLAMQLNFTDEQISKINDIFKAQDQDSLKVLTPGQQQTLKEQLAEQPANLTQRLGALKLTVDQQTKIVALRNALMQEMRAANQNGQAAQGANPANAQASMRALQDKYIKQLLALLTPEQIKILPSDFAQAYGRLQTLLTMVPGQDEDQRTKIAGLRQDAIKQAEAIRDDATLNDEQKTAKMNDLFDMTVKCILAVLPPDQQKQTKLLLLAREYQEQQLNTRSLTAVKLTDDQQAKIHAITQKAQQDIMQVLTAEQQQKLQDLLPHPNAKPQNN